MKKSDPFQVEPLPKAFYYPSKEKELSKKEKKVCLSVPAIPQQNEVTSPEDLRFLKDTNALKVKEIPTRENGSFAERSSSSQFNESWPSTEQTQSPSTPVSDVTSIEMSQQMKEWLSGKPDIQVSKSTLGWYINRFRNAPPTSRQIRDKSSFTNPKQGEFWWLSPPSGQSTPVLDTPPQKLNPSPLNGTLKASKLHASAASTASLQTSDKSTEDLNKRAKELLERSETSMDSTSTEPFPLPLKRPVLTAKTSIVGTMPRQRSTPDASSGFAAPTPSQSIPSTAHKNPWPEDDILYQWRLARKMEKAQERAKTVKSGGSLGFSIGPQRPSNTQNHIGPRRSNVYSGCSGLQSQPDQPELFPLTEKAFVSKTVLDPNFPVPVNTAQTVSPMMGESYSTSVSTTIGNATKPTMPFVSSPCRHSSRSGNHCNVPPHMHLACDILPCSCSKATTKDNLIVHKAELPHHKLEPLTENHAENLNSDGDKESERLTNDRSSFFLPKDIACSRNDSIKGQSPTTRTVSKPDENENRKKYKEDQGDFESGKHSLESSTTNITQSTLSRPFNELNDNKGTEAETLTREKRKNERNKENYTDKVVDNIIGKVVSEHLFCDNLSSDEDKSCMKSPSKLLMPQPDQREDASHYVQSTIPLESLSRESSEEEFIDDEILTMLRQRSRDLKMQLREIDQQLMDNL